MIPRAELRKLARTRLKDAEILCQTRRYDGAVYLCGYAVELLLKARICRTLNWSGFPETRSEFDQLQSFRTHNLDILLRLSGIESNVKTRYFADWLVVAAWEPELRYRSAGSATRTAAYEMIQSTKALMGFL